MFLPVKKSAKKLQANWDMFIDVLAVNPCISSAWAKFQKMIKVRSFLFCFRKLNSNLILNFFFREKETQNISHPEGLQWIDFVNIADIRTLLEVPFG